MTTKSDDDQFALSEIAPSFGGSLISFGGDGASSSDRRKIADLSARQVAAIVAQKEKIKIFMQCMTEGAQESTTLIFETQEHFSRINALAGGKPYALRVREFNGRIGQIQAAQLMGAQKLLGDTMAVIVNEPPYKEDPDSPKGFLARAFGK